MVASGSSAYLTPSALTLSASWWRQGHKLRRSKNILIIYQHFIFNITREFTHDMLKQLGSPRILAKNKKTPWKFIKETRCKENQMKWITLKWIHPTTSLITKEFHQSGGTSVHLIECQSQDSKLPSDIYWPSKHVLASYVICLMGHRSSSTSE